MRDHTESRGFARQHTDAFACGVSLRQSGKRKVSRLEGSVEDREKSWRGRVPTRRNGAADRLVAWSRAKERR